MHTLLITIIGSQRNIDLQMPGKIPICDLIPALLEICGPPEFPAAAADLSVWGLRPTNANTFLPTNYCLSDAYVSDGAVLVLQNTALRTGQPIHEGRFIQGSLSSRPARVP